MDPLSFIAGASTVLGIIVTLLNLRERLWPRPAQKHPLEPALREIAAAIYETKSDQQA